MEEEPASSWMRRRLDDLRGRCAMPGAGTPSEKSLSVISSACSSCAELGNMVAIEHQSQALRGRCEMPRAGTCEMPRASTPSGKVALSVISSASS